MKNAIWVAIWLVAVWQVTSRVQANEQPDERQAADRANAIAAAPNNPGLPTGGTIAPLREGGQADHTVASSLVDIAARAQSKWLNHAAALEEGTTSALMMVPVNDNCANRTLITGEGTFAFDNTLATLDGAAHTACGDTLDSVGTMDKDVWYCWTSPCTGPVLIQTCAQTAVDTKLAVYDGCTCPATSANILGCNDDGCGTGSFLQSRQVFPAETGQGYMIRLGTYPGDIGDPNNPLDDLPAAPGGAGTFSLTCLASPCAQPPVNCQEIKANAGSLSDRTNSLVADNFKPASSGNITNICWWGNYYSDTPPVADAFRIRYFANTAQNVPGMTLGTFDQGTNLTVSGPVETAVFGAPFPIFECSATHAPVAVSAGQTYWVEISNVVSGDAWYWQQGFGEDRSSLQDGAKENRPSDPLDGYTLTDQIAFDHAFCAGIPIVQPPSNPCLTATNSCCAHSVNERGCGDRTCCETVCACDPFCCSVTWDINCATDGLDDQCGAQLLCPGLCAGCPDGTISWLSPLDCTVDARQPHLIDNAAASQGITQVGFGGPAGADNENCWTAPAPNQVQNIVDHGDGTFTLSLAQPAAAYTETPLTHTSDTNVSQTGRFISHPGNVNGDLITNTGDVTTLSLCCLDQTCSAPFGLYSCDTDHSGAAASEDLIRLIDLLNGGGAFSLWNQTSKPATTCP